jgi:hypothetical protein
VTARAGRGVATASSGRYPALPERAALRRRPRPLWGVMFIIENPRYRMSRRFYVVFYAVMIMLTFGVGLTMHIRIPPKGPAQ